MNSIQKATIVGTLLTVSFFGFVPETKADPRNDCSTYQDECHADANCLEGIPGGVYADLWRNQSRAVVRLEIPESEFGFQTSCTGTLMNNRDCDNDHTDPDCGVPYIMTAAHCLDPNGTGRSQATHLDEWKVFLSHEANGCGDELTTWGEMEGLAPTIVVFDYFADVAVVVMEKEPSKAWSPFYMGWNYSQSRYFFEEEEKAHSVMIHHPCGNHKKFTAAGNGADGTITRALINPNSGSTERYYGIRKWETIGKARGGSSGAPLFNYLGYIIGVLSGGITDSETLVCTPGRRLTGYERFGDFQDILKNALANWILGDTIQAHYDPAGARFDGGQSGYDRVWEDEMNVFGDTPIILREGFWAQWGSYGYLRTKWDEPPWKND